jgi:hypothetical protein
MIDLTSSIINGMIATAFFLPLVGKEKFIEKSYEALKNTLNEQKLTLDEESDKEAYNLIVRVTTYLETGECTCPECIAANTKTVSDNDCSSSNT